MLMFAAVNVWVIYRRLRRDSRAVSVGPAEGMIYHIVVTIYLHAAPSTSRHSMIYHAQSQGLRQTSRGGTPRKCASALMHVGSQLPVKGKTRPRWAGCVKKGLVIRTETLCIERA